MNFLKYFTLKLSNYISSPSTGQFIPPKNFRDEKWHLDFIVHLASILKPKKYLEVGIHHCGLFNKMIPFADNLLGVDINPASVTFMDKSNKVKFYNSTSVNFFEEAIERNEKYDFIFIDADHSKDAVKLDFYMSMKCLSDQGILVLHDTFPINEAATSRERCDDGYLAIEELGQVVSDYELVTIPIHPGITICRKRRSQVNW